MSTISIPTTRTSTQSVYTERTTCRLCHSKELEPIIDLGEQCLTGVFPKNDAEVVPSGPLELMQCKGECGLVQLRHSYEPDCLYGDHYGYRSGLNASMVSHLQDLAQKVQDTAKLNTGDLVVDIGSNDGTFLSFFSSESELLGIDPASKKFARFYPEHVHRVAKLFSPAHVPRKAKIITAIAMMYDLEQPLDFVQEIADVLDEEGVFLCEQSYLSSMVHANAYDTICHEHIEYYSLAQLKWMFEKVGLKIIDVEFNNTNGGSVCVMATKKESSFKECVLPPESEIDMVAFREAVCNHRKDIKALVDRLRSEGKVIYGYGASTKGNVLLQYCGFTKEDIPCIAEVNEDKFGCVTPFTHIPIVPEEEAKRDNPDYFLVLPWHFRENIVSRNPDLHGKLIFPLPKISIL